MVGTLNSVIANTKVNTLKFSYTHEDVFFGNPGYFETDDQAALAPLLVHQTFEDGIATRANRRMDPAYQIDETFAWFLPGKKGDHDLKFGASYYYLPLHVFDAGTLNGSFGFSASDLRLQRRRTRAPIRTGFTIRVPGVSDYFVKGKEVGLFAQDKWKVNSRFTASLGLRYDVEVVPMDQHRQLPVHRPARSIRSTRTTCRRGSAAPGSSTSAPRPSSEAARVSTSRRRRIPTSRRLCRPASTSSFVPVNFPANNVDPGPSHGRLPTDPFLVNGPVVNRALLNQQFPAGTTTKNTGTVDFDNPDRHLPYAHQASVGIEKQLAGSIAVSADYVHASIAISTCSRN